MTLKKGDIVQVNPDKNDWGPSLVVVEEVKDWGVQGYTYLPRQGPAYIRLEWGDIELTGGEVVWDIETS